MESLSTEIDMDHSKLHHEKNCGNIKTESDCFVRIMQCPWHFSANAYLS